MNGSAVYDWRHGRYGKHGRTGRQTSIARAFCGFWQCQDTTRQSQMVRKLPLVVVVVVVAASTLLWQAATTVLAQRHAMRLL